MDLQEELTEGTGVMEIAVDGLGRVEVHNGRVRITLTRTFERRGKLITVPAITVVWTVEAWLAAQLPYAQIRALVASQGFNIRSDECVAHLH